MFVKNVRKRSTTVLYVGIKYSVHDQLCDVISYFACSCGIGKICVHDKILIENP